MSLRDIKPLTWYSRISGAWLLFLAYNNFQRGINFDSVGDSIWAILVIASVPIALIAFFSRDIYWFLGKPFGVPKTKSDHREPSAH